LTLLIIGLLTDVARQLMQAKQFGLVKVVLVLLTFLEATGHPVERNFR